jgi:hypothetical protein
LRTADAMALTQGRLIRVASVPSGHVYVQHLADPLRDDGVARLDDPVPAGPVTVSGQWWPPAMLSASWVKEHRDEFDVFHIQFGFDAQDLSCLRELVKALREAGKPLVYTVHDLRNPHHPDRGDHDAQLGVLIPAAGALITLTNGAAAEIESRWGRRPIVLPHPHVVDPERLREHHRPDTTGFVVGVHAKSVRASMDPLPVIRALADVVPAIPGGRLQVNIHHDVFDAGGLRHDRELAGYLAGAAARSVIDLRVHDCFTDDELWQYLESLDVSVLPYRFGTHSGWLEACFDLGTTVAAPDCGYIGEQRPCLTYRHSEEGLDIPSLQDAVTGAFRRRPHWQARPEDRLRERIAVAGAHRRLYQDLLA